MLVVSSCDELLSPRSWLLPVSDDLFIMDVNKLDLGSAAMILCISVSVIFHVAVVSCLCILDYGGKHSFSSFLVLCPYSRDLCLH